MTQPGPYGPMGDYARSDDPAVQRQLDRLFALSIAREKPSLEPVLALLDRIGNPQHRLPPVLHVAGTNGKGSTCAFLRAAVEAAGLTAHVYTSPHLVRFNERMRIAGKLIEDAALAPLLEEVLNAGGDIGASFFEVSTAAALLAFSRAPADACILEVGLGGDFDATNVVPRPAATAIAQLGLDHERFLGTTIEQVARHKAGIARANVPLVTMRYPPSVAAAVAETAAGAKLLIEDRDWFWSAATGQLHYRDGNGDIEAPLPALAGPHQAANLALAIAILRAQTEIPIAREAMAQAALHARWPARMQLLGPGPLTAQLPAGAQLWLDGGHNPAAGEAIAAALRQIAPTGGVHLIFGMLTSKPDIAGLLAPIAQLLASVTGVPVPGHEHHEPAILERAARDLGIATTASAADPAEALRALPRDGEPPIVLILGSLYLAGTVLEANSELPG